MWTWLASLIGGPVVNGLIDAYKAKLDAANTQDRIAAETSGSVRISSGINRPSLYSDG